MTDTNTDTHSIDECNICFEFGKFVVGNCCHQQICEKCFDKWTAENKTCPYCRHTISKNKWLSVKKDIEYKIHTIIDTCLSNGINILSIVKEDFNNIKEYLIDYNEIFIETTKGNLCICNTNTHTDYYGHNDTIILNIKDKIFYQYYTCSNCATLTPRKLWNKMVINGNINKCDNTPSLSFTRNELIRHLGLNSRYDISTTRYILEQYLGKKYITTNECIFIQNLLSICSGEERLKADILYMLVQFVDVPSSKNFNSLYLSKIFFDSAWKIANKYNDFVGLYPIVSLWNIIRNDNSSFLRYDQDSNYYLEDFAIVNKFLQKWKEDIE